VHGGIYRGVARPQLGGAVSKAQEVLVFKGNNPLRYGGEDKASTSGGDKKVTIKKLDPPEKKG